MAAHFTLTAALLLVLAGFAAGAPVHQADATVNAVTGTVHHLNVLQTNITYDEDAGIDITKRFLFTYKYTWYDIKDLQDQLDGKSSSPSNVTDVIVAGYVMPNPTDINVVKTYHYPFNSTMPADRRAQIAPVAEPLEKIYDQIISVMTFYDILVLYCTIQNPFIINVFTYRDSAFNFENIATLFQEVEDAFKAVDITRGFTNGTIEKLHEIFQKADMEMPSGSFPNEMTTLHFGAHFQEYLGSKFSVVNYLLSHIYPISWAAMEQVDDPRWGTGPDWW